MIQSNNISTEIPRLDSIKNKSRDLNKKVPNELNFESILQQELNKDPYFSIDGKRKISTSTNVENKKLTEIWLG